MIRLNHRKYKCLHNYIELEIKNHIYGIGRTNPGSPNSLRRWTLTIDDYTYDIRSCIFSWSRHIQTFLYKRGVYWHNWLIGECTPGFECCIHKVKKEEDRNFLKNLVRASLEQTPLLYYKKGK